MKHLLVVVICFYFVGCMHYIAVQSEKQSEALEGSDCNIKIRLKDGSEIHAVAHHYLQVNKPSSFIYMTGKRHFSGAEGVEDFTGKIPTVAAETLITSSGKFFKFSFEGSTIVSQASDVIRVNSVQGTGIWTVNGKIDQSDIEELKFERSNVSGIAGILIGAAMITVPIVLGIGALAAMGK